MLSNESTLSQKWVQNSIQWCKKKSEPSDGRIFHVKWSKIACKMAVKLGSTIFFLILSLFSPIKLRIGVQLFFGMHILNFWSKILYLFYIFLVNFQKNIILTFFEEYNKGNPLLHIWALQDDAFVSKSL